MSISDVALPDPEKYAQELREEWDTNHSFRQGIAFRILDAVKFLNAQGQRRFMLNALYSEFKKDPNARNIIREVAASLPLMYPNLEFVSLSNSTNAQARGAGEVVVDFIQSYDVPI